MNQYVLDKFFSDSRTHLSQQQPQAAGSVFPFSEPVRQEDSRSLPVGSLPPLSADGVCAERGRQTGRSYMENRLREGVSGNERFDFERSEQTEPRHLREVK